MKRTFDVEFVADAEEARLLPNAGDLVRISAARVSFAEYDADGKGKPGRYRVHYTFDLRLPVASETVKR